MVAVSGTWLQATCALSFSVTVPTPMVLMLRPRSTPDQWVAREAYRLAPSVQVIEFTDGFGNLCQRLIAPVGEFRISTSADVLVINEPRDLARAAFVEVPDLPDEVLVYLLPSRYCESDRFGEMATAIVDGCAPGYAQVAAIAAWVNRTILNTPGSSTYPVSAGEINVRREGVCRDLAHFGIAMCRALCIPARLVVGYLCGLTPMDIHAWFEAFVGGEWHTFDPTGSWGGEPRISIAHGRDATDVAIYNQFGPALLPDDMQVTVDRLSRAPSE